MLALNIKTKDNKKHMNFKLLLQQKKINGLYVFT